MTEISRRGLIGAGAVSAVLVPLSAPDEAQARARKHAANLYKRSRFKPLRAKKFSLSGGGHSTKVRLAGIDNLPATTPGDEHRFTLTFTTARTGPPQGTYTLRRRGFAATTLFVVPDARRRSYRAVVNRAG